MAGSLRIALQVAEGLQQAIAGTFGPGGSSSGLMAAGAELRVTCDGIDVINILNPLHPIAKYMVAAVQAHHRQCGDGVKTFVLLLAAALHHLCEHQLHGAALSRCIQQASTHWLPSAALSLQVASPAESESEGGQLMHVERQLVRTAAHSAPLPVLEGPLATWLATWVGSSGRERTACMLLKHWSALVFPEAAAAVSATTVAEVSPVSLRLG